MDVASLQTATERFERAEQRNKSSSISAALSRSLASTASLYFSRPIRLFRPTKVSAFTAVQALAHERGQTLSASTLKTILKDEGWRFFPRHVLPPFIANTLIGFGLFFTYSSADFVFRTVPHPLPDYAVPFVCGALAGSAQAIISSPLDNVRMLLARRSEGAKFTWMRILKEAVFPVFLVGQPLGASRSRFGQLRNLARWTSRGWSLYGLSLTRDALGFGMFFAIFEAGRRVAKRTGMAVDHSLASKTWPQWLTGSTEEERKQRGWIGRTAQAVVLVAGGTFAGLAYGVVGKPFDVTRQEIWQARMAWAEKQGWGSSKPAGTPSPPRSRLERLFASFPSRNASAEPSKRSPLPSARSVIRELVAKHGIGHFFAFPTRIASKPSARLDSHPALGGASVFTTSGKPRAGPRIRSAGGMLVRVFSIVPPYSIAFLAYAITQGDLST